MSLEFLPFWFLLFMCGAVLILSEYLIQKEGEDLLVNCSVRPGETRRDFTLLINDMDAALTGRSITSEVTDTGTLFTVKQVTRSDNSTILECLRKAGGSRTHLTVQSVDSDAKPNPKFGLLVSWISNITLSEYSITVNAGTNVTVNMTYDANPVPVINVTKSGSVNSGVNYLLTTRDFTFTDVEESDAGVYNVNADNFAGSAQAVFTLTVTKDDDDFTLTISVSVATTVAVGAGILMTIYYIYKRVQKGRK